MQEDEYWHPCMQRVAFPARGKGKNMSGQIKEEESAK